MSASASIKLGGRVGLFALKALAAYQSPPLRDLRERKELSRQKRQLWEQVYTSHMERATTNIAAGCFLDPAGHLEAAERSAKRLADAAVEARWPTPSTLTAS